METSKGNAIILVSGGMDSCVTAAQAIKDSYKPFFLHINYGQRTKQREEKAFKDFKARDEIKSGKVSGYGAAFKKGGSISKMKRGGLASKK